MPAMSATSRKPNHSSRTGRGGPLKRLGQALNKLGQQGAAAPKVRMARDTESASPRRSNAPDRQASSLGLPGVAPKGLGGPGQGGNLVDAAQAFVGQPYKWGGGHSGTMGQPGPVDCSGLVQQAGRRMGVNLDGTAATQQKMGRSVSMNDLKPGDLVFRGSPAHHVGIYAGNGLVLHAPKTGSKVSYVSASYFQSARRVVG